MRNWSKYEQTLNITSNFFHSDNMVCVVSLQWRQGKQHYIQTMSWHFCLILLVTLRSSLYRFPLEKTFFHYSFFFYLLEKVITNVSSLIKQSRYGCVPDKNKTKTSNCNSYSLASRCFSRAKHIKTQKWPINNSSIRSNVASDCITRSKHDKRFRLRKTWYK